MVEKEITSVTIDSRFQAVAPAVESIVGLCRQRMGPSAPAEAFFEDLRLGLTEALNNVIEHAYDRRAGSDVEIDLAERLGSFVIRVRDTGRSMPGPASDLFAGRARARPEPDIARDGLDSLAEGGWGLFMLQQTMDRVEVERAGGENRLTLEKCFAASGMRQRDERPTEVVCRSLSTPGKGRGCS